MENHTGHRHRGVGRDNAHWKHRKICEVEEFGYGQNQYEVKVWFPEFNATLNFLRLEDYDAVMRSGSIDEIRDDITAHRRVWTFHQVEQELRRIAMKGRRAARATSAAPRGEPAQIQTLIARIDQQQRAINDLVSITASMARKENEHQNGGGKQGRSNSV